MLAVILFCCQEFGWTWEYAVSEAPLAAVMLLARQKVLSKGEGGGFTLQEQERMDRLRDVPWEELVRRNREELARTFKPA